MSWQCSDLKPVEEKPRVKQRAPLFVSRGTQFPLPDDILDSEESDENENDLESVIVEAKPPGSRREILPFRVGEEIMKYLRDQNAQFIQKRVGQQCALGDARGKPSLRNGLTGITRIEGYPLVYRNHTATLYSEQYKCNRARNGCKFRIKVRVDEHDPNLCLCTPIGEHMSSECLKPKRHGKEQIALSDDVLEVLDGLFQKGLTPFIAQSLIIPHPSLKNAETGEWQLGVGRELQEKILALDASERSAITRPQITSFWKSSRRAKMKSADAVTSKRKRASDENE